MPSSSTSTPPHPGVRRQRVGLPAGPVERRDQRRPEALAQRVLLDQRLELADDVAAGAEVDARRHRVLDAGPAAPPPAGSRCAAGPVAGARRAPRPGRGPDPRARSSSDDRGSPVPPRVGRTRRGQLDHPRRRRPRPRSTVEAVAVRRRPPPGRASPSARRSCETLDCSVFRAGRRRPTGPRAARRPAPGRPRRARAAPAARCVLPAGTSSRTPSRWTSTAPEHARRSALGSRPYGQIRRRS